ncbi:MAG: GNAT family N-acetyltransferase [Bacilli bacterium]
MEIKKGNLKIFIGENEDKTIAFMSYSFESKSVIIIDHTFVSLSHRGQNLANELFWFMIQMAKENSWLIKPKCSYVIQMFVKNVELQSLLAK